MGEDSLVKWIEIDSSGKIIGHFCALKMPEGDQYREVTDAFNGTVGMTLEWLDMENGGRVHPVSVLEEKGLVIDRRGVWYHKQTRQVRQVTVLNEVPGEEWTKEVPDPEDPYSLWDAESGSWIHDAKVEALDKFLERKAFLEQALAAGRDHVLDAFEQGVSYAELYPEEAEKRNELRTELNSLEAELQEITTA